MTTAAAASHWREGDVENFKRILDQVAKHMSNPPENLSELASRPVDFAAEERRVEREWREHRTEVLLRRIPERFRAAIPRREESLRWLDDYADGLRRNVIMSGPVESGKTWEASAVAIRLLRKFIPVTIIEVPELMDDLRPGSGSDHGAGLASYQAAPVLVLDDMGTEKQSEWTDEQLYSIVNSRYKHMLPTIVTTNLSGKEFLDRYGPRITRRLCDDAVTVVFAGR